VTEPDNIRDSQTSLSKATVGTLMHHGVIACDPDASLRTVARAMESYGVHCVLVAGLANAGRGERFVWAVVTDADLVAAATSAGGEKRAAEVAQTEAPTIEPSASLADAARTMSEHGVTHLIVAEPQSERPVGVVSSSDIVRSLALEGA
jgi:CBS domain-containing protein